MTHRLFSRRLRRLRPAVVCAVGLCLAVQSLVGCTSDKQKAKNAIKQAVDGCRNAKSGGPFYEVELFGDTADKLLKVACGEDISGFELTSDYDAHAQTGPIRWSVRVSDETGVWTLYSAEFKDLKRAQHALEGGDVSQDSLSYAAKHYRAAQKAVPDSPWLKLRLLETLLDRRMKARGDDTPKPTTIGPKAQAQYDATVKWADAHDDLDTKVEAQYLVVAHLQDYMSRVEMVLSADGSSDQWLINAAEQADKDDQPDKAAQYRQELADVRAKRAKTRQVFSARQTKLKQILCTRLAKLSPAGVDDSQLQERVAAAKSGVDCMKKAADNAGDQ